MQHTLARSFRVAGIGLHGGAAVAVEARPAPVGSGRTFVVGGVAIPATLEHVADTFLATTIARGGARVSLVEHLLSALHAAGVDNAELHVEGGEIPVLDGSARGWCAAIAAAGLVAQDAPRRALVVREPVEARAGESWARLDPADTFELDVTVDFPHPAIGLQRYVGPATGAGFVEALAWARTFGFLRDAEALRARGLARGASLDNTVVYGADGPMNPDGLRAPDEVVRHKALDAVGDAALLGAPLRGRLCAYKAGHALHVALFRALLAAGTSG